MGEGYSLGRVFSVDLPHVSSCRRCFMGPAIARVGWLCAGARGLVLVVAAVCEGLLLKPPERVSEGFAMKLVCVSHL